MNALPSIFPVLTTPLSVGQFVGGALAGTVSETQVALGCAMIARACDVYLPPAKPDAVSLQTTPADIKGLVELFKDPGRRSEVAPRLTEKAPTIAAIVSAFLSTGQELRPPPPPSVPQSLIDQGAPPAGLPSGRPPPEMFSRPGGTRAVYPTWSAVLERPSPPIDRGMPDMASLLQTRGLSLAAYAARPDYRNLRLPSPSAWQRFIDFLRRIFR